MVPAHHVPPGHKGHSIMLCAQRGTGAPPPPCSGDPLWVSLSAVQDYLQWTTPLPLCPSKEELSP